MTWKTTGADPEALYNGTEFPSLDLKFADNKTLVDEVSGQNLITFSRSSIGTYVDANGVIQTASTDTPRFDHDPVTGESLGLLIEESRTNYLPNSNSFPASVPPVTVGINFAVSPDGTVSATRHQSITNDTGSVVGNQPATPGQTYTLSVYAKRNSGSGNLKLVIYDLPSAAATAQTFTLTNEWQRFSITRTVGAAQTSIQCRVVGTGSFDNLYWGAQLEQGSFPTSYIPTSGSTVTRAADVANITGSNFSSWFNQNAGSFYYEGAAIDPALNGNRFISGTHPRSFLNAGNTGNNRIGSWDGTYSVGLTGGATTWQDGTKAAAAWSSPTRSITISGLTAHSSTSNQHNVAETQIRINQSSNGSSTTNGYVKRLTYYPYRLSDTRLQTITT